LLPQHLQPGWKLRASAAADAAAARMLDPYNYGIPNPARYAVLFVGK